MVENALNDQRKSDFYELLQVSPRATPDVIQAAYRVLSRSYHPDISRDPNAGQLMRQLNAAYDVLSDPEGRAKYDARTARSARVLGGNRAFPQRHDGHASRPRAAHPTEQHDSLPVAHAIAGVIIGIIALLLGAFGFWLVYQAIDDEAPLTFQSSARAPELASAAPRWSPPIGLGAELAPTRPGLVN